MSDQQGGFRTDRGCPDQIFALHEIVMSRKECGQQTVLAFIDVAKAYDRVWRPGLWLKLKHLGIGRQCLSVLRAMFDRVSRNVLINDDFTEFADVQTGVPQGAVLSPYLYAVYIDGLTKALKDANLGTIVYGEVLPLLLYADDIVLLARDRLELQRMLDVVSRYAMQWRFDINHGKCGVVTYGSRAEKEAASTTKWILTKKEIKSVSYYKYLGIEFNGGIRGKWNLYLKRICAKAKLELQRLAWKSSGFRDLSLQALRYLWTSQIRPILEYSAAIWEGDVANAWEQKLEAVQNLFAKMALGFSKKCTPAAVGVRAEIGLSDLKSRRSILKLGYWQHLCNMKPDRLVAKIFRARHLEVLAVVHTTAACNL